MLTVFTPTYNRGEKLRRLYNSLLSQSDNDLEWLIVDDGSTDNTAEIISEFSANKFPIRYYKKKNGGKHTAYNYALEKARGEIFICVDSDDYLAKDVVSIISKKYYELNANIILAYKVDTLGNMLSQPFPQNLEKSGILQLADFYNCRGEFTLIFKTEYAKQYPFPIFKEENFVTESVVYDRMFISENAFLLREIITVCEYQKNGLTNNTNKIMKKNPAGYCLYFMQRIDLQKNFLLKLIISSKYHAFCFFAGKNKTKYVGKNRFFVRCTIPIGLICWLYYKAIRKF